MTLSPLQRAGRIAGAIGLAVLAGTALIRINRGPDDSRIIAASERQIRAVADADLLAPDAVLIAGDSHAAAIARRPLCGTAPIPGGVGGATAPVYARTWSRLDPPGRYRAIVLSLGSNDQQARRHPEERRSERATRAALHALIAALGARTATLIVLATPPISAGNPHMSRSGLRARNGWVRELCARGGCRYLDPYASTRADDGATLRQGYSEDGVHYNDYEPIRAEITKLICPVTHLSQTQKTDP